MSRLVLSFVVSVAVLAPQQVWSATLTVRQDGSGDFATINGALASAGHGDTIEVGPGVYTEKIFVNKVVELVSSHGAHSTILDGEQSRQIVNYRPGSGGAFRGFTLRNGWFPDGGGAMTVVSGATTVAISDCVFAHNAAGHQGGAFSTGGSTVTVSFTNCEFVENVSGRWAGAAAVIQGARVTFDGCRFSRNSNPMAAGAIGCGQSFVDIVGCSFERNGSGSLSGAIRYEEAFGRIEGNTFFENTSQGSGTVYIENSPATVLHRNIFAGDTGGAAVGYVGAPGVHSCNIYWNNDGGPMWGDVLSNDEIIADPLFCTPKLYLAERSPAAMGNSPCGGQIGAFPVGCGTVAVEQRSWGQLKASYD